MRLAIIGKKWHSKQMIHFVSLLEAAPFRLNADLDQQAATYFSTRKYAQPWYKG